jgi:polyhydroxyalkanoate synthesis regulator protein
MEEVGKQNMAMMERAFSLFAPFYRPPGAPGAEPPGPPPQDEAAQLAALRAELEALREQLAKVGKAKA